MRSASGRFGIKLPGSGHKDHQPTIDTDGPGSPSGNAGSHSRVASGSMSAGGGSGGEGFGRLIQGKLAHTSILPSIIGNASLRELQDLISAEKGVMNSNERLSNDLAKACSSLEVWGNSEGSDLSDVLAHASSILGHLSAAFAKYADHEAEVRSLWKGIRTKEEELEDLIKKRKSVGSRAEKEEKKLAKMGQENKNLMSQTELLQSLRDQMKTMDTDILTDEAKLGDYKRRSMKAALGLKFGGCLELAEKATIVGELGKLLIEEIPLEETPPGYGRAPYQGFEQTARLAAEAERCISEVQFVRPEVKALPPGLPQARQLAPLQTPSTGSLGDRDTDNYSRQARAYADDPHSPSSAGPYESAQLSNPSGLNQGLAGNIMFQAPTSPPPHGREETYSSLGGPPVISQMETVSGSVDPYGSPESLSTGQIPIATTAPWRDEKVGAAPISTEPHAPHSRPATDWHLDEDGNTRTLTIGQWSIQTAKKPILNGAEIDAVTADLNIPLPEMTFGNNHLTMSYSNGPAGLSDPVLQFAFSALHGLADVAAGEGWEERVGGGVQVSMAEHWNQNRTTNASYLSDTPISAKPTKPFDWTYSTTYAGTVNSSDLAFVPTTTDSIPMELLARQDPILDQIIFYDDVPLFEDELHDNGQSIYNVRIRVMPHSYFVLARLFLRVDDVIFRLHDVRVYHEFGTEKIIREITGYEGSYDEVKHHLETPSDLNPLTDANFVSRILPGLAPRQSENGKPWPGIGLRKEVLILPTATQSAHDSSLHSTSSVNKTKIIDRARPIPRSGGYDDGYESTRKYRHGICLTMLSSES